MTSIAQTRTQLAKIIDDGSSAEAADFTASRILDKCVVEFRAGLPPVVEDAHGWIECGNESWRRDAYENPRFFRREATKFFAVAEYLEAKEAREAEVAKEAELTKRRDALANELYQRAYGPATLANYSVVGPGLRTSVDMLMEVQDKLAKYEEAQA